MSHLDEARAYHANLNDYAESVGLSGGASWASWRNHPISNVTFWFWCHVPHRAKMRLDATSVGSIDHEYRDAELVWLSERCERCGFSTELGTFVPADR